MKMNKKTNMAKFILLEQNLYTIYHKLFSWGWGENIYIFGGVWKFYLTV